MRLGALLLFVPLFACSSNLDPSQDDESNLMGNVASNQSSPRVLTADATNVYWSVNVGNDEGVYMRDLAARAAPVKLAAGLAELVAIAVDAQFVYWVETSGSIFAVPKAGGAKRTLGRVSAEIWAGIAIDEASSTLFVATNAGLWHVGKVGSNLTKIEDGNFTDITSDASNIYYTRRTTSYGQSTYQIVSRTKSGMDSGALQLLDSRSAQPYGLSSDDDFLYFATGDGQVGKVSKAGGPSIAMPRTTAIGAWMGAGDGTTLCFASSTRLACQSTLDGAVTTIAEGYALGGVAIANGSVYWSDSEEIQKRYMLYWDTPNSGAVYSAPLPR